MTVDFEGLPASMPLPMYPSVGDSRLSNQLAAVYGVVFSSESLPLPPLDAWSGAPFIAVVTGFERLPSGTNAIASVNGLGYTMYLLPIRIQFVLPADPNLPALTDYVSIRGIGNPFGGSGTAMLEAFDINGTLLGFDMQSTLEQEIFLSVKQPGIHSVRTWTENPLPFDDLTFDSLTEPLYVSIQTAPIRLSWKSHVNRRYQAQYSRTLASETWTNFGDVILGDGSTKTVADPSLGQSLAFYRVMQLP